MKTKLILITGRQRSGKSTVAEMLRDLEPTVHLIAQSDPMKDLAREVFQFSEETLNGPSESRNVPDPRWDSRSFWEDCEWRLGAVYGVPWLDRLGGSGEALPELHSWLLSEMRHAIAERKLTARRILRTLGTEFGRRRLGNDVWVGYALRRAKTLEATGTVIITDGRFANEAAAVVTQGGTVVHVKGPDFGKPAEHASEAEVDGIPFDFEINNTERSQVDDIGSSWHKLFNSVTSLKEKL